MQQQTTNAVAGGGAVQFFGESSITPCGPTDPPFVAWTNTLFGSFTVSAWIKTSNIVGGNTDNLQDFDGQNVIYVNRRRTFRALCGRVG